MNVQPIIELSVWESAVDIRGRVTFDGVVPEGEWEYVCGSMYGGAWEHQGAIFSAHRCLCVLDNTCNNGWTDCGLGPAMEVATRRSGSHYRGPGGPLRVQPPPQDYQDLELLQTAVGAHCLTRETTCRIIVRPYLLVDGNTVVQEFEFDTFDPPRAAFAGIIADVPILCVEFDLADGEDCGYQFINDFHYGRTR